MLDVSQRERIVQFRLRHLEVLEAVLRTGSTLAAAESLHVTQPVVSRTIKHAEQRLGYALFSRHRGRLEPTPEAQALVPELNAFFAHWRKVQDYAENLAEHTAVLRVAVNPALIDVLPRAVMRVNQQMPHIQFRLLTLHTKEIVDQLLAEHLDVGITQGPLLPAVTASEGIGKSALVMLVPRAWDVRRPDASLLTGQPFIGLQNSAGLGEIVDDYLCRRGCEPIVIAKVQTYRLAVSLVEQGLGATIVDQFTAQTANNELVRQAPLPDAPGVPIYALYHPRHIAGNAECVLREDIARILNSEPVDPAAEPKRPPQTNAAV